MAHEHPDFELFTQLATQEGVTLVPMYRRLLSDLLTPVLAYRRLVQPDERMAPSFLLESVVGGNRIGRYSYIGVRPAAQMIARGQKIFYIDQLDESQSRTYITSDPLSEMANITADWRLPEFAEVPGFSHDFPPDLTGGWVGFAGYDTVRYLEGEKLSEPPPDDRGLPDLQMALYRQLVAFDHVQKTVLAITHVVLSEHSSLQEAYVTGQRELEDLVQAIRLPLSSGLEGMEGGNGAGVSLGDINQQIAPPTLPPSNMGSGGFQKSVEICKQYIASGDIFQVVPSQRFELMTRADPFDVYRSLRVVNPSPYMFYIQIEGAILVGSSPEILCRVQNRRVINRPLAGTRRRGRDEKEDRALEVELLADPKDRAEHIMLVDLGRNDVGRVAVPGSIELSDVMTVERYSHVMHISSQVVGTLRDGLNCWDALRVTLPVGTVSGAPKVRAMQVIDELEVSRRGPYAGAVGYADFAGNMDMAIALRTMVVMPIKGSDGAWRVHVQAGAGIVADSDPDAEHEETVNKAAALATAIKLAEQTFANDGN